MRMSAIITFVLFVVHFEQQLFEWIHKKMNINGKIFPLTFAEVHVYTIIYHRFMKNQEITQWPWKLS